MKNYTLVIYKHSSSSVVKGRIASERWTHKSSRGRAASGRGPGGIRSMDGRHRGAAGTDGVGGQGRAASGRRSALASPCRAVGASGSGRRHDDRGKGRRLEGGGCRQSWRRSRSRRVVSRLLVGRRWRGLGKGALESRSGWRARVKGIGYLFY